MLSGTFFIDSYFQHPFVVSKTFQRPFRHCLALAMRSLFARPLAKIVNLVLYGPVPLTRGLHDDSRWCPYGT